MEHITDIPKIINNDNIEKITNVPVGASAFGLADKLKTEMAGTGVHVSANTKVLLGPKLQIHYI